MKLIDLEKYPVQPVLGRLLQDKTTKQNIIFATDNYSDIGAGLSEKDHITLEKLTGQQIQLKPRVEKAKEAQKARTKTRAEIMSPCWLSNIMNNHCDTEWFGRENVFNIEQGQSWVTNTEKIAFETEGERTWEKYVDSRRLEITCGEAPYIVSRYDTTTGEIIPMTDRIGILDRKLRVVDENAANDEEWLKWTQRALESSYGYEFQGDNLLIARINVLLTLVEHYEARFHENPDVKLLQKYANIICWNFWQMDGLTGTIPFSKPKQPKPEMKQLSMFEMLGENEGLANEEGTTPFCLIKDWRANNTTSYDVIRGGNEE